MQECREEGAIDRIVEVGILQDDDGVLAAHFEDRALQVRGAELSDFAAHSGGASEADARDARVLYHLASYFLDRIAPAGNDVKHARREARCFEQFTEHGAAREGR